MVVSVISQLAGASTKLSAIAKFANIKGSMMGTTLFQWPWRCTTFLGVIWIMSSRNVFIFSIINNQEVTYSYFFAFDFSSNMLILLFNTI
jgi:hypothetical protein